MSYGQRRVSDNCFEFEGEGLARYDNRLILDGEMSAMLVCRLLGLAYRAGQNAKAKEIREALHVPYTGPSHW